MEHINFLAFAIPAFFIFIYLEYRMALKAGKSQLFSYEESVSNLSIGIAERLTNLFIAASCYSLFEYVYLNFKIFEIPNTWWIWIVLILATDLVFYWYHRLGHEVNLMWAAHIVHHQSEGFNLTVATRITTIQALIRTVFWCVLPLLGFNPFMVTVMLVVHGGYAFFTHTQLVGKLGWLEHILITPSLHGVHHASDEIYLDKNYGDVFVFWDKIFGTYQKEVHPPTYGLTHPIKSRSFLWLHFHYYLELIEACRREKYWSARFAILFGSPAKLSQDIRPLLEKRYFQHRRKSPLKQTNFRKYLNIQLVFSVTILALSTAFFFYLGTAEKMLVLVLIILTLINCGALLEQRKYIFFVECSRIIVLIGYILYQLNLSEYILLPVILLLIAEQSFALNKRYRIHILKYEI